MQFSLALGLCEQGLSQEAAIVRLLKTERIEVYEESGTREGEAHFQVVLPDRLRERHFEIQVDRSVCVGKLKINGNEITGENLDEVFRFDRGNQIIVTGCLERKPEILIILAHPKVFIERAKATLDLRKSLLNVEVTIRNTLLNSVSCTLTIKEHSEDFYVGPETSQTRGFFVRLKREQDNAIELELYKYPESMEGAYRQIQTLIPTRIQP